MNTMDPGRVEAIWQRVLGGRESNSQAAADLGSRGRASSGDFDSDDFGFAGSCAALARREMQVAALAAGLYDRGFAPAVMRRLNRDARGRLRVLRGMARQAGFAPADAPQHRSAGRACELEKLLEQAADDYAGMTGRFRPLFRDMAKECIADLRLLLEALGREPGARRR